MTARLLGWLGLICWRRGWGQSEGGATFDRVHGCEHDVAESNFSLVCERLSACGIQWEHADPDYSELHS